MLLPETTPLYAHVPYTVRVPCIDRFGNQLERGGAIVSAQIRSPTTLPLPPQQETLLEGLELDDGSYALTVMTALALATALHLPGISPLASDLHLHSSSFNSSSSLIGFFHVTASCSAAASALF